MHRLIKNADIYTPRGFERGDLLTDGHKVMRIAPSLTPDNAGLTDEALSKCETIDLGGRALLPGLVDLHVHFREPGYSYKETIAGGCAAAEAGGFKLVCTMPNLNPAPDTLPHLREQLDLIAAVGSRVRVLPYATITTGRLGSEFPDYEALAPLVAGFSDDGNGVQSADVMREAMRRIAPTGKIVAAHCEVNSLLQGGYIHDGEYARANGHRGICSESEWREIERDINLAAATGCRLHICHISTAEGVNLVRQAKKSGLEVTCETGPHYLWFADCDLREEGRFKMNPPLRSAADREALREGVADGTIDVIATDHAPHSADEKARGLEKSAPGVVGLETSFGAVYTMMCLKLGMPFGRLVDAMSLAGRRILRRDTFEEAGITVGSPDDFTVVDLEAEYVVDPAEFSGSGRATPFEGVTLVGKPLGI